MTDPGASTNRRFNEKEVALIIKRASELQQNETTAESTTGMSLAELEQVAREAGLDPELVRRAAADLDTRVTDQTPNRFLGAPTVLRLERTIDGEVPTDEYEPMVLEMQRLIGGTSTASTIGRTLQFSLTGGNHQHASGRDVQVTITPRNGRTTIRIEERLGPLAGGLFGGLLGGMGGGLTVPVAVIGAALTHSAILATGLGGVVISGSYLLARTIYGRIVRGRGEKLHELMSWLVEHAS
ncbi:MAG TPA: hypothetical protein VF488_10460, partial [Gemmatimonadaceae bacterium]